MQTPALCQGLDGFKHQDRYNVQVIDFENENNHSNELKDDTSDKSSISWEMEEEEEETYEDDEASVLIPIHDSANDPWANLRRQYPWSVSDPGPSSLMVESYGREYYSSPIVKGGLIGEHDHQQGKYPMLIFDGLIRTMSKTLVNHAFLKWVFILLNVIVELCQATLAQEAAKGKIQHNFYLKLSIITSLICLIMLLLEACYEGKRGKVVLQKKGCCYWFYYPGIRGRVFGNVSLYFGIISSTIQLIFNLTTKLTKKKGIYFDYVPLLLSVCYLFAAIVASREKSILTIVKCHTHGYNAVEGHQLEGGTWVFECPECQMEINT